MAGQLSHAGAQCGQFRENLVVVAELAEDLQLLDFGRHVGPNSNPLSFVEDMG